ncbi:conjugative transfer protein TraA, partial [mine drainage metagenome]
GAPHRLRLALLGDDHQRASIEAGGMFSTLMRFVGGVSLSENLRQKNEHEREAVALLRRGYTEAALSLWAEHGQLKVGSTVEDLMTSTLEAWAEDRGRGQDSVILCRRNADAVVFNSLARARLIEMGKVSKKPCLTIPGKNGEAAREFHAGEQILLTRNDSRLE